MKILNEINDKILGHLMCFSDEDLEPRCWGKYLNYKLFFREEIIIVKFDLYFCDVNYYTLLEKEDVVKEKMKLWKVYQEFLLHGTRAEDTLFQEFSQGCFLEEEGLEKEEIEEYRKKYKSKEELFKDIKIIEVRINFNSYDIIISVPWREGKLSIVDWDLFDEEHRRGFLMPEEETYPVEMEYIEEDIDLEDINYAN